MNERLRILIVDDDELDRRAARRALQAVGLPVEIEEASDCATALAALERQRFDCAFLDYQFPDGDGLDVVRAVRQSGNRTPIVMLTGYGDELVAVELMKAGASDYLAKSVVSPESLGRCLRNVLRVSQAEAQAREAEEALRQSEERYRFLAESIPQIVWTARPDGGVDYWNGRWYEYTGLSPEESQDEGWSQALHPDDLAACLSRWEQAVRTGESYEIQYRLKRADGAYRWHLGRGEPWRDPSGRIGKWFGVCTDIDDQRRAQEREALVNRIGKTVRASLDAEEIMQIAAQEVGQALGVNRCSWAWLDTGATLLESAPQQYCMDGVDSPQYSIRVSDIVPAWHAAWSQGQPVVADSAPDDPRWNRARAFISCPLFLRGQWSGLFTVHQTDGPRAWTGDEIALLTAITDLLAPALENARRYAREHRVAEMLSSAFLTDMPPLLPGLALASSYEAGMEEAQVGGDYYDAFSLPDGRVALVIADVSGKGLEAAIQTATVKYSLRAFATEAGAPSLVLDRLNRTLRNDSAGLGEHFVTLFYAVFDPATGRLTYASAGHETLLIKRASGGTTILDATGPILGVVDHAYRQADERLHLDDSLLLYTDGLTEARAADTRSLLNLDRVIEAVNSAPRELGPGELAARLQRLAQDWSRDRPQDDMALLVARCLGTGHEAPAETHEEEPLFQFSFSNRSEAAAEVRQAVGHWMVILGFKQEALEDFQTAVTEAINNAVRHGFPDASSVPLRIRAGRLRDGAVAVEVFDDGPGLIIGDTPPAMPGPDAPDGRGLPLMREFSDTVESLASETGHCLRLTRKRRERARK